MTQFTHDQAKLAYDYIKMRVLNKTTNLLYDHANANDINHFSTAPFWSFGIDISY